MADSDFNKLMGDICDLEDDFVALTHRCKKMKQQYADDGDNDRVSFTVYAKQEDLGALWLRAKKLKEEVGSLYKKRSNDYSEMAGKIEYIAEDIADLSFNKINDLEDEINRSYAIKDKHSKK